MILNLLTRRPFSREMMIDGGRDITARRFAKYQRDVMARYTSLYVHYRVIKLPGEAVIVGGDNYASRRRLRKAKAHRLSFL